MFNRSANDGFRPSKRLLIALLVMNLCALTVRAEEKTTSVVLWDTQSPFFNGIDLSDRAGWKAVPTESDRWKGPDYYGPEEYGEQYSFKGDAVVENEYMAAVFLSRTGRVVIYRKANIEEKTVEFVPLQLKGRPASIVRCGILRNSGDASALRVSFTSAGRDERLSAVFSFSKQQTIEIKPAENMRGAAFLCPIKYGIVPDFISDDLIFDAREYPSADALHIALENLFVGLLQGREQMLVLTWPKGKQRMKLVPGGKEPESRLIESVDLENDGKSIYLAILDAPGIWHEEELKPSYLEKDVVSDWKRPFPAKWITQLYEDGVRTTFTFREPRPERFWRGGVGFYIYPVWFNQENTYYHLGKKVPPKEKSLVYFLERANTPASVSAPVDILKEALGAQTCRAILDFSGRQLRSHRRENAVIGAATCEVTDGIQPVFEQGREVEDKEYIAGGVDDMLYFIARQRQRVNEYQSFAGEMMKYLAQTGKSHPDLKAFLNGMEEIVQEMLDEHSSQRENMKTLEYADQLARETKALTQRRDPRNLQAFIDLKMKWRGMGGTQDYLVCKSHTITRKLFQEAGYRCMNQPGAVEIAQEIRSLCRESLRNPDGYEIWPDY